MLSIHFLQARYLLFGMPAIVIVGYALYRGFILRMMARKAYGEESLIAKFSNPVSLSSEMPLMLSRLFAVLCLVIVIANPVSLNHPARVPAGSTQVIAVIDVSPSMAAEDHRDLFPPYGGKPQQEVLGPYGRRIDEVAQVIEEQLLPAMAGNELGIVLYEGEGKDQVDLADDFQKVKWEIDNDWLEIGQAPGDGSDYGKGLEMALTNFATTPGAGKEKVIILFSDGGADDLDRQALAKTVAKIKAAQIKVIVIAVGSEREMKVPRYNERGLAQGYVHLESCEDADAEGNCQTKLNLAELSGLAANFNSEPVLLNYGKKLPIAWASYISGSKAENQPEHLYKYILVPCLIVCLLIEFRALRFRRRS